MKQIILGITFLFFSHLVNAQELTSQSEEKVYETKDVDVKPEFPKGTDAFYKFIAKNFKSPEEEGLNGKIIMTFVIETDGSISNIKVLQDVGYGSGEEAMRVLKKTDKWIPGKFDGKPVRVLYHLPITIQSAVNTK
ncbi:MAG: energy transducer TonB [Flavobacterium sp.]